MYEQVAEQLLGADRRAAACGRRRPAAGARADAELGVGRSSIREALRMLESQGVIRAVSGGSFVVADARTRSNSSLRLLFALDDRRTMHDLFELRRILECEAAALAAERHASAASRADGRGDRARWTASLATARSATSTTSTPTCASTSRSPRRPATGSSLHSHAARCAT